MKLFVSNRGTEELDVLRVGGAPVPTGGRPPIELLSRVPSEECGCPEELWLIEGILYLIHMEVEDGTGEIFVFAGDFEEEYQIEVATLEELRAEMFAINAIHIRTPEGTRG